MVIFDYTHNRAFRVTADSLSATSVVVVETNQQPLPTSEEWNDALAILRKDSKFGPALAAGELTPYKAMPPLATTADATGHVERALHMGLLGKAGASRRNQIVAVNLIRETVALYESGTPPLALAQDDVCGAPTAAACASVQRGTAGQLWIAWPSANPVWRFLVKRPSASSGTRGSGIEILYADYQGKRVLYQGHTPILNVLYDGDACGPYRDWIYEEWCFQADGTDVAPGFRWCPPGTPPRTICESGVDGGNFQGVAIHESGDELVLTSVLSAGWYRYMPEWRFHKNGSIRPLFRFGATENSCVCNVHTHHVYWRLDFDITTAAHNAVDEFNLPPLVPNQLWLPCTYEGKRLRDPTRARMWRVKNINTHEAYEIVPGDRDVTADAYGKGDFWLLAYHGVAEYDDGYNQTGGSGTAADIDRFINGERVDDADVVIWYAAHFRHDLRTDPHSGCHVVGPLLRPAVCAVTETARGTTIDPNVLRSFRDQYLAKSPTGQRWLALLDQYNIELAALVAGDAALRARAQRVLKTLAGYLRTSKTIETKPLDQAPVGELEATMEAAALKASPGLREAIRSARADMAQFAGRSMAAGLKGRAE